MLSDEQRVGKDVKAVALIVCGARPFSADILPLTGTRLQEISWRLFPACIGDVARRRETHKFIARRAEFVVKAIVGHPEHEQARKRREYEIGTRVSAARRRRFGLLRHKAL